LIQTVAVIGLGTLGGFLCKHIADLDGIKELIIIDHDIVEGRNTFNSIYRSSQVGEYKVEALSELLNEDVTVTKINKKYIEGITSIPLCDLVIDCRDYVCNRMNEIDLRLFISGKILVIDCRKQVKTACEYKGSYSIPLTKYEINKAAFYAAQIIDSPQMENMTKNELVQRVDLDILPSIMHKAITKSINNKMDLIYENPKLTKRLQCIEDNIKPILERNKSNYIDVYIGERQNPTILQKLFNRVPEVAKTKYAMIPAKSMVSSMDVMEYLSDIVKAQPGVTNFIVTVRKENGNTFIELLEETGAA
jgi:hypothetical protein